MRDPWDERLLVEVEVVAPDRVGLDGERAREVGNVVDVHPSGARVASDRCARIAPSGTQAICAAISSTRREKSVAVMRLLRWSSSRCRASSLFRNSGAKRAASVS